MRPSIRTKATRINCAQVFLQTGDKSGQAAASDVWKGDQLKIHFHARQFLQMLRVYREATINIVYREAVFIKNKWFPFVATVYDIKRIVLILINSHCRMRTPV